MTIRVQCRDCGKRLKVRDTAAGKRVKCPDCGCVIRIPKPKVESTADEDYGELDFGALSRLEHSGETLGTGPQKECPSCGELVAEKAYDCDYCGALLRRRKLTRQERREVEKEAAAASVSSSSDDGSAMGWVWFILVFGVGNFILYQTTGWIILPIPRR